ncbi:hypothetical protein IFM89_034670 [Coptis chinensis]|uniref:PAZ domain-containing protein n=1 Tax=Coptis chinensis TaxID=261450 RepID=A0A835HR29_9MAGN|nr:hypothetical protein IFM89_034670 [Coptis chinensis]
MNDFLPVSMRDITKSASEGGRIGWDEVGGLVNIQNAVRELLQHRAFFFFDEFHSIAPKRGHDNTGVTDFTGSYDVAATLFYEAIPVVDYVQRLLNLRYPSQPLSDSDRIKVKKAVKGLRVELTHRKEGKRNKISGITTQPVEQLMFLLLMRVGKECLWLSTSMISIMSSCGMVIGQLFKQEVIQSLHTCLWMFFLFYSSPLCFGCLHYIKVCKIVEGQRYSKKLNEKQVTAMLRASCQHPKQREDNIQTMALHNDYKNDRFAKEFGIEVIPQLAVIQNARVLPAPMLKYHDTGRDVKLQPRVGQWNMINVVKCLLYM